MVEYPKAVHGWNEAGERLEAHVNDAGVEADALAAGWTLKPSKKPGKTPQKVKSITVTATDKKGKPVTNGRVDLVTVPDFSSDEDEEEAPAAPAPTKAAKAAKKK